MRLLRTHVGICLTHPTAAVRSHQDGGIRCEVCAIDIGQWTLPWRPQWVIVAENIFARTVAHMMPHSVVRWALKRAVAHATQPRWGDLRVQSALTIMAHDVALRWELDTPAPRLPHLPEWLRGYMTM